MSIRSMIGIAAAFALAHSPTLAAAQVAPANNDGLMSINDIEQRLTADGFRVIEIERYASSIEVKGYDRAGVCIEMHLDPRSGDMLRRERDDDCGRDRGDDGRGRRSRH